MAETILSKSASWPGRQKPKTWSRKLGSGRLVEFGGEWKTIRAWAEKIGINPNVLGNRVRNVVHMELRHLTPGLMVRPRGCREHGTSSMYRLGCRCDACRAAMSVYQKNYSSRRREKSGAR